MLKALIRSRLAALWASMVSRSRKKSTGMAIAMAALLIYAAGCLFVMSFGMFSALAVLLDGENTWAYFGMVGIMSFALCFLGSVFTAKTQLYEARDNDLLLSMPIKPGYILASRMALLLILDYCYQMIVAIPALIIYFMNVGVTFGGVVTAVLSFVMLPLLSLAVTCFFGWLLSLASSRIRKKALVTTVFYIAMIGAYMYFYSKAFSWIEGFEEIAGVVSLTLRKVLPIYVFGAGAAGNYLMFAFSVVMCVLPFVIAYWIISKSFIKIVTTSRGTQKVKYVSRDEKMSAPVTAFMKKELRHLSQSPIYMMNSIFGLVFALILAAFALIKSGYVLDMAENMGMTEYLPAAGAFLLSSLASWCLISAPSISLEGKNIWIAQSAPVHGSVPLLGKVRAHIALAVPVTVVCSLLLAIAVRADIAGTLAIVLLPAAMNVFQAYFGVIVNLRFYRLDWLNETIPVKQGVSILICMFGTMFLLVPPALVYIFLLSNVLSASVFSIIVALFFFGISLLMRGDIMHRGAERFEFLA